MRDNAFRALLVAVALGAAGCANPVGPSEDLGEAERRWIRQGITSYRLVFDRICFCLTDHAGRFEVTVVNGNVTSVRDPQTGRERGRFDEVAYTVPELFDVIEREEREADELEAEYHGELGYPTSIRIDRIRNAIDDELEIQVLELTPLR